MYTELETRVIKAMMVAFNYRNPENEKDDNATATNAKELAVATRLPVDTVKGIMGSLTKKGLMENWMEPGMEYDTHITAFGIDEFYRLFPEMEAGA